MENERLKVLLILKIIFLYNLFLKKSLNDSLFKDVER